VTLGTIVQLTPGLLACDSKRVEVRSVSLRQDVYNVGIRGTIESRESHAVLAYLPRQRGVARLNGEPWLNRRLAVVCGSAEFCSDRAFVLALVEFELQRAPMLQRALGLQRRENWVTILASGDPAASRLQSRVTNLLEDSEPIGLSATAAECRLIGSIGLTLETALRVRNGVGKHENGRAMAHAAERYMWSHVDDDIGLDEICRGIGCHRRTLLNYFNKLYGMSPIRYLKILRLNRAQTALRESDPLRISIFDVAADHGFWHMGHFSSDYRYLFGETPSETLHGDRFQTFSQERHTNAG
jgi:AraC-like DNA-binding protein